VIERTIPTTFLSKTTYHTQPDPHLHTSHMTARIGTIPTFVFCLLICSINSFSLNSSVLKRKDNSCCQSSISLDDDRSRLPTGAFGITGISQEAVIDTSGSHHSAGCSSLQTQVFDVFDTTSSPLIPISRSTSSPRVKAEAAKSYDNDLDLPSHSRVSGKLLETTAAIELSLSRVAMIAALGLFTVEITTGTSFVDQILRVI
jgi:hypothetical protein